VNIWDVIDRANSGARNTEKEFDMRLFKKTTELVKKYDIKFDGTSWLPLEDHTVDNVFKAGVELLADLGCFCTGTNRVVKFTRQEIMEALRNSPSEVIVGEGNDARRIYHRGIEDQNPPAFFGGTWAPFEEGNATVKIAQSIAQLPFVDILGCGNLQSIEGRKIACLAHEVHASRCEIMWHREGTKRAHRPGLAICYYPISTHPATMIAALMDLKKSDVILASINPELRIEANMLATVVASLNHGCIRMSQCTSILNGFAGGPEGTSICGVASAILPLLAYKAHMIGWHITPMSVKHWYSAAGQWTDAMPIQALARNTHVIMQGTTATSISQPCTKMAFFEVAARLLLHVPSGSSFILAYRPFAVGGLNHVTPLEIAFAHEVIMASMKYKRKEALEIAQRVIAKFKDMIESPPEGKSFLEAYDFETLKPKEETLEVYERAKEELREIGLKV